MRGTPSSKTEGARFCSCSIDAELEFLAEKHAGPENGEENAGVHVYAAEGVPAGGGTKVRITGAI